MSLQPRNRCDAATLTPPRLLPKNVIDGALELASRFAEARVNGGDHRLVGGESLVKEIGLAQRLRGRWPSLHGPRGDEAAWIEGGLDLRGLEAGGLAVIGPRRLVEERGGDSVGPEPPILAEPDQNAHDLVRGPPRQVALARPAVADLAPDRGHSDPTLRGSGARARRSHPRAPRRGGAGLSRQARRPRGRADQGRPRSGPLHRLADHAGGAGARGVSAPGRSL